MLLASVLLPLYIYPSGDTPQKGTWGPLFDAISANPQTDFTVIVNPDSGPGSDPYPDDNYIAHIAQLNTYPSVTTLGYTHASYTDRDINAVEADIQTYANWANYADANIAIDGIFIDEAPGTATNETLSYMKQAASTVRAAFPARHNTVMTNPGVQVDVGFYAFADFINVFENAYSQYTPGVMTATPKGHEHQATAIMYGFTGNKAAQHRIMKASNAGGYGGLLVTTVDGYYDFSALWTDLCSHNA